MRIPISFLIVLFAFQVSAQDLLRFEVAAGNTDRIDCPVSLSIDQLNYNTDSPETGAFRNQRKD